MGYLDAVLPEAEHLCCEAGGGFLMLLIASVQGAPQKGLLFLSMSKNYRKNLHCRAHKN